MEVSLPRDQVTQVMDYTKYVYRTFLGHSENHKATEIGPT